MKVSARSHNCLIWLDCPVAPSVRLPLQIFYRYPLRVVRVGHFVLREVYGRRSVFASFNKKLYEHGTQSFLLCFKHCAKRYLRPYCHLFHSSELVRCLPVV